MRSQHFARFILLIVVLFFSSLAANAQALPTATRRPVQIGGGFTLASPDYGQTDIRGFSGFASIDITRRLGAEVDAHYISIVTPSDVGENSYLIGPRYNVLRQDRFAAYVKVTGGLGQFEYQQGYFQVAHSVSFLTVAFGAGIEYRATRHINIRAIDIEAQKWPTFSPNTLSPFVVTIGAAYIP